MLANSVSNMRTLVVRLIIIILAGISLLETCIHLTGFGAPKYREIRDQDITSVVTKKDGKKTKYRGTDLPLLNEGDRVTFSFYLPDRPLSDSDFLCFYQYHSLIEVRANNGMTLGQVGFDQYEKGQMPGDTMAWVYIPRRYLGTRVTVSVLQVEGVNSNHATEFRLMPSRDMRLYPLLHGKIYFVMFFTMLVVSLFLLAATLITQAVNRKISPGAASLCVFCFFVALWQLTSRRQLYILFQSAEINAVGEYFSIMGAPGAMFFYLSEIKQEKWVRRVYGIASAFYSVSFALGIILHYGFHDHIVNRESVFYDCLMIGFAMIIFIELVVSRKSRNFPSQVIRVGIVVASILVLAQLMTNFLHGYAMTNPVLHVLTKIDFSSIATLTFVAFLVSALYFAGQKRLEEEVQNRQNQFLAYHDLLTGLYNRVRCEEIFDRLDTHPEDSYAILFFDADGLKKANDTYGHNVGDELIRATGENLQKSVKEEDGFASRWGGDEFLIFLKDPGKIDEVKKKLEESFRETDESGRFPFPYSVSYGTAVHISGDERSTREIREIADERMYEMKKERKAARV